jgi:hypothetical protein
MDLVFWTSSNRFATAQNFFFIFFSQTKPAYIVSVEQTWMQNPRKIAVHLRRGLPPHLTTSHRPWASIPSLPNWRKRLVCLVLPARLGLTSVGLSLECAFKNVDVDCWEENLVCVLFLPAKMHHSSQPYDTAKKPGQPQWCSVSQIGWLLDEILWNSRRLTLRRGPSRFRILFLYIWHLEYKQKKVFK